MVDSLSFDKDAVKELHRAKCYYDTINKSDEFLDDFQSQVDLICTMPFAFQIRYKKIRIVKLNNFPFSIHYTILKKHLIILNLLNQSQDF